MDISLKFDFPIQACLYIEIFRTLHYAYYLNIKSKKYAIVQKSKKIENKNVIFLKLLLCNVFSDCVYKNYFQKRLLFIIFSIKW